MLFRSSFTRNLRARADLSAPLSFVRFAHYSESVDHPCHRCHAPVPEGNAFCGQCGAPQIRVNPASQPEASPQQSGGASTAPPLPPPKIVWSQALPKCAVAGFFTVFVMNLSAWFSGSPLVAMLTLPMGGMFAVWIYRFNRDDARVTRKMGSALGAATGLFSAVVAGIIAGAQISRPDGTRLLRDAMAEQMKRNPNPEAQQMMEKLMTPEGVLVLLAIGGFFLLILFLGLCTLGGAMAGRSES